MPFDGSGNFDRVFPPGGWAGDAAASIKISATRHDTHDKDLADGLTNCLTRDGQSQPTANIPMGNHRITNLATPVADDDAATQGYVKSFGTWPTSKTIAGSGVNGRLIFSGSDAVGLEFTGADLFWGSRPQKNAETSNRLVLNSAAKPPLSPSTAGDVLTIDERGHINNNGQITNNLSWSNSDSTWRVIPASAYGSLLQYTSGDFTLASNDVPSTTNPYTLATLRNFFNVNNSAGSTVLSLHKSASAKGVYIQSTFGAANTVRWRIDFGGTEPESTPRNGSDFSLWHWSNAGDAPLRAMHISRATNKVTFAGEVAAANLSTTDASMIVGPSTAGSDFSLARPISSGTTTIYGGTSGTTGAYLQLYGETYIPATAARDIVLGAEGSYRYWYDYDLETHHLKSNSADIVTFKKTTGMVLTGNATVSGTVAVTGMTTLTNLTISDNTLIVGSAAADSAFSMARSILDGSVTIFGGSSGATGSYFQLFGETHSTAANDIIMGAESAIRYRYDYSIGAHIWLHASELMRVTHAVGLAVTGTITSTGNITGGGHVTSAGNVTSSQNFISSTAVAVLAAAPGGSISLRPDGSGVLTTATNVDTNGNLVLCNLLPAATGGVYAGAGIRAKTGSAGAYGTTWMNFVWNGTSMLFYSGTSLAATFTPTSDYRIKRDIQPLPSMWDRIKALKPISFRQKAFDIWADDDTERWGFVAHELQNDLSASAASGEKDGTDVQSVNPLTVLAALTKALQEAMERIETLEGASA